MDKPIRQDQETPLKGVRTNIVQSIRAFRVSDLQEAAGGLGQHFLYANLSKAQSKQDVLDLIAAQFTLPSHFGKNFDALYDSMTDPLHKSGPQPGFIVVLEHIPANLKFDKEAREQQQYAARVARRRRDLDADMHARARRNIGDVGKGRLGEGGGYREQRPDRQSEAFEHGTPRVGPRQTVGTVVPIRLSRPTIAASCSSLHPSVPAGRLGRTR